MPLPESHIKSLQPYVRFHNVELKRLRALYEYLAKELEGRKAGKWRDPNPKPYGIVGLQAEVELVARMIKTHDRLLAFARDERGFEALAELLNSRDSAQQAALDPIGYANKRGIELPPGLEIECTVGKDQIVVQMNHFDRLLPFSLTWTNEGFMPPP